MENENNDRKPIPSPLPWKILAAAMTFSVVLLLLAGAICFVFAGLVAAERRFGLFTGAVGAGLGSFVIAWLLGRGVRSVKIRAYDLAIARHAEAIRQDFAPPLEQHSRGVFFSARRDYARAIAHFDAAMRLYSTFVDAHIGRVNSYAALGQGQRVVAEYTAAIERDPKDAVAHCARATAYNGLGQFELAIADADAAIALAPEIYVGYDARGYGLLQRSAARALKRIGFKTGDALTDCQQAVADFTEALRLQPRAWDCYRGRARAYRGLGEHAQAASDEAQARGQTGE